MQKIMVYLKVLTFLRSMPMTNVLLNTADNLIKSSIFSVKGYPDFILDDSNWLENPFNNRTWMWHLHQMSFLVPLLAYDKHNSSLTASKYAMGVIRSWAKNFQKNTKDVFAWHDHATSIRSQNLIHLLIYLQEKEELGDVTWLKKLLKLHAEQLYLDSFYSKATNHGLDQAMALFELAYNLSEFEESNGWLNTAVDRVNFEISHAFSDDGGHKENSPAYLNYGLKQVKEAKELGVKYEGKESRIFFSDIILEKAITALSFITRPDGKLPLIGDTKNFVVKDFFGDIESTSYQKFIYSIRKGLTGSKPISNDLILKKSGWAIFRSSWEQNEILDSLHLVLKCGFLSNYHRHDDDLSFTLFAYGEEWLIDGGEYKHAPKDPYRIYMRSAESHNISMPYCIRAHRDLERSYNTGIRMYDKNQSTSTVFAESEMFDGFRNNRLLKYDRVNNSIHIHDNCKAINDTFIKRIEDRVANSWITYCTRFMIPSDKKIEINKQENHITIYGKKKNLRISYKKFNGNISLVSGQTEPNIRGWCSKESGVLDKAYSLELRHLGQELDFEYSLTWLDADVDKIVMKLELNDDLLKVSASVKNQSSLTGKLQYAFYLMYNNEKVDEIKYQSDNSSCFKLSSKMNPNKIQVISYIRDTTGNKLRHNSRL
jgi:hypothetical protein